MKSISTLRLLAVIAATGVSLHLSAQSDSAVWTNVTKPPTNYPKNAFDSGGFSSSRLTVDTCAYVRIGVSKTLKPKAGINAPFDIATYSMRTFAPTDTGANNLKVDPASGFWEGNSTVEGIPSRYIEFAVHPTTNLFMTGIKVSMVSTGGAAVTADFYYSTDNWATSNLLILGKDQLLSKDTIRTFNIQVSDVLVVAGGSFKVRLLPYNASKAASKGKALGFENFVIYANTTPLPVKFSAVSASRVNNQSVINWVSEGEVNVASYAVEKSTNGIEFKQAGTVPASSRKNYSFTDPAPASGVNYYRIKSIDKNGAVTYSSILKVLFQTKGGVTVFPNPVANHQLNLQVDGFDAGNYAVNIYSISGQKVASKAINLVGSSLSQAVTLPASIKAGTYELEFTNGATRVVKTIAVQ
ncbi:T9SS type A sorting domain-containing protein [Parasediminibacterium sp. JCM 36343]|uniref:T9SS type A sorting domain-containing protein n=1 Tax=Parasediminibacterium sp. JCM 36343 TaxID=3374279 RepID=UPI003978C5C5